METNKAQLVTQALQAVEAAERDYRAKGLAANQVVQEENQKKADGKEVNQGRIDAAEAERATAQKNLKQAQTKLAKLTGGDNPHQKAPPPVKEPPAKQEKVPLKQAQVPPKQDKAPPKQAPLAPHLHSDSMKESITAELRFEVTREQLIQLLEKRTIPGEMSKRITPTCARSNPTKGAEDPKNTKPAPQAPAKPAGPESGLLFFCGQAH